MHRDPDLIWEGAFPYEALAPAGITPQSKMSDVQKALDYFLDQESPRKWRKIRPAWDQLRLVERRLFIDFFLYRIEASSEKGVEEDE